MTTPTVAYEQNGHTQDDGWYPGMESLPDFKPEIHRGDAKQDDGSNRDWNKFLYDQSAWQNQNPLGVLSLGKIKDPHELRLMDILQAIFLLEWNAEVTNRKGLRAMAEKDANVWKGKFGDEALHEDTGDGRETPTVEDLLDKWHSASAFMTRVATDEALYGLSAIEQYRSRFIAARESRKAAEFDAATLTPARNKYFWAMVRTYNIDFEENEDIALGRPIRDYTETKKKLTDGVSVHRLVGDMTWAYQMMHARVFASVADGDTLRDYYATLFTHQWPYDRRPKKERSGLERFFSRRDDDEDEEDGGYRRRDEMEEEKNKKKGIFGRGKGNGRNGK